MSASEVTVIDYGVGNLLSVQRGLEHCGAEVILSADPEKILAAKRAGIKEIILCDKNRRDIDEIDERYLKGLKFHFVTDMYEVIDKALLKEKAK